MLALGSCHTTFAPWGKYRTAKKGGIWTRHDDGIRWKHFPHSSPFLWGRSVGQEQRGSNAIFVYFPLNPFRNIQLAKYMHFDPLRCSVNDIEIVIRCLYRDEEGREWVWMGTNSYISNKVIYLQDASVTFIKLICHPKIASLSLCQYHEWFCLLQLNILSKYFFHFLLCIMLIAIKVLYSFELKVNVCSVIRSLLYHTKHLF